jgi:hypothetical protein
MGPPALDHDERSVLQWHDRRLLDEESLAVAPWDPGAKVSAG